MNTTTTTSVDLRELYFALDQERRRRMLSWRDVAKELGVASAIFTRLKYGSEPELSTYSAFCDWLDTDLGYFQSDRASERRAQRRANASPSTKGDLTADDRAEIESYASGKKQRESA